MAELLRSYTTPNTPSDLPDLQVLRLRGATDASRYEPIMGAIIQAALADQPPSTTTPDTTTPAELRPTRSTSPPEMFANEWAEMAFRYKKVGFMVVQSGGVSENDLGVMGIAKFTVRSQRFSKHVHPYINYIRTAPVYRRFGVNAVLLDSILERFGEEQKVKVESYRGDDYTGAWLKNSSFTLKREFADPDELVGYSQLAYKLLYEAGSIKKVRAKLREQHYWLGSFTAFAGAPVLGEPDDFLDEDT